MKIQVVSTSAYPMGQVTTDRVHHICKGLVECGADLELMIVHPTETAGRVLNHRVEGVYDHVRYRYAGNKLYRNRNLFVRKLIDFYCHLLTIRQLFQNPNHVDFFIVIGVAVDFRLILPLAARIGNAKIILEINEYPYVTKENNLFTWIKRFILFRGIFPVFDGFIVISEPLHSLVDRYKSSKAAAIVVPILCDCSGTIEPGQSPLEAPYMIHAGSILENKDGILGILKAFKIARDSLTQPIKFVITGEVRNSREYR
jgi:glycosyltransferase involved in cell wall biosynthesis